ncbi:MAG: tetratricopeptide repeat protein [Acidobacteriota bacterium]|nr:tetratricopeptide repeat protein [Acidobacteriota bacterium]
MRTNTNHPEAVTLVSDAMSDLDHYKQSRELERLISANDKLEKAISLDPKCMRFLFYGAMVNDLVGKAKDAAEKLEKLLRQNPPSADEVEYNLGVAYYHRYSHKWLEKADAHFRAVIDKSENTCLKLLAHAGLAQTHAMWIIQRDPKNPDERAALEHFSRSEEECNLVSAEIQDAEDLDEAIRSEIKWTIFNARGMSLMYYTDYFENQEEKIRKLGEALKSLTEADRYSPKNWANYCDLGSVNMRLGYWRGLESDFQMALQYLREVVTKLRPNYGFAMYEIGRVFRLIGEFEEAINWFDAALQIDPDYRDVGNDTVNREKDRAARGGRDFP